VGVTFRAYPRRWFVLAVFCLGSLTNGALWITFSPIADEAQKYFDVSDTAINMLSLVFLFLYPVGTLLCSLLTRYSLSLTLYSAFFLNGSAGLLRIFAAIAKDTSICDNSCSLPYWLTLVGQVLAAIGQPFFTNLPLRVASRWFTNHDIPTVIGSLSNLVGTALGQILPTAFVSESDASSNKHLEGSFFKLMLASFLATWTGVFAAVLCLRESPPTPPSAIESVRSHHTRRMDARDASPTMLGHIATNGKRLLQNGNFLILCGAFGFGLGLVNSILTLIEQLVKPIGYDSDQAGIFGSVFLGFGLAGAILMGILLEITHSYRGCFKFGVVSSSISLLCMVYALRPNNVCTWRDRG